MAVVGGNTKSVPGRLAEVGGWFPALLALIAAGGASFADANHLMQMPDWAEGLIGIYRSLRDSSLSATLGKAVPDNYADIAVAGVSLLTMATRKVLSFSFSIGGFILLAVLAWYVLGKLG